MGRLTPLRVPLALAATLMAAEASAQQPVFGRSDQLGIAFAARGEAAWCSAKVDIDLTADSAEAYRDSQALQQMIGRIRAAVTHPSECPGAELVYFHAFAGDQLYFSMLATRLARWRVFDVDVESQRPRCHDADAGDPQCSERADAFAVMHQVFADKSFADMQLTTALSVASPYAVEWRGKTSRGTVRILDANSPDLAGWTVPTLADATVAAEQEACEKGRGRFEASAGERGDTLAAASARCRRNGKPSSGSDVVIWLRDTALYVFAIAHDGAEVEAVRIRDRLTEMLPRLD